MGFALEIQSGRTVNAGATITAVTAATGDSTTIKAFNPATNAYLLNLWALQATAGFVQIRSPRMHDNVRNIQVAAPVAASVPLLAEGIRQPPYPQDVLVVAQSGGGAETDALSWLNFYEDLPGATARLARWMDILPRIEDVLTIECVLATGATLGDYVGSQAINATFDLLEANRDYAILGFDVSAQVLSVGLRGPDTGNLRVGGPGPTTKIESRDWFKRLSEATNLPTIPIINAANKGATLVDVVQTAATTNPTIDFVACLLAA